MVSSSAAGVEVELGPDVAAGTALGLALAAARGLADGDGDCAALAADKLNSATRRHSRAGCTGIGFKIGKAEGKRPTLNAQRPTFNYALDGLPFGVGR